MVFEAKIVKQREVAKGTHEVTFERPASFAFQAGQYMQVAVTKLTQSDVKGASRLFSIASSPDDFETLRITFRISGSGFKETLRALPLGSTVTLEQAAGRFLLPQTLTRPQVFIAGGVGISPFMSFLRQNEQAKWNQPITLVYGNQNPQSAAYLQELKLMTAQQKQFSLEEVYKRPTVELFMKLSRKHTDAIWWVVGPPAMVALTVNGLQAGGIAEECIRTESFDGY
jgi:ferredoxin-NADP reductase